MSGVDTKGEAREEYFDTLVREVDESIIGALSQLRIAARHCVNISALMPDDHPLQKRVLKLEHLAYLGAEAIEDGCYEDGERWLV